MVIDKLYFLLNLMFFVIEDKKVDIDSIEKNY